MKTSRIITTETHAPQREKQAELMIFGTPKERLDFYRREIQYETSLLAGRLPGTTDLVEEVEAAH